MDPKDVENGRIPRAIECELTEDLADTCTPGDLITVNGILKVLTQETSGLGRSSKDKTTHVVFIDVNSIQGQGVVTAELNKSSQISFSRDVEFVPSELAGFKAIQNHEDPFKYDFFRCKL
jgi:DNA helicase MCM8